MNSVADIVTQKDSIENFMDTMLKAATFKKTLIVDTGKMLSTRLKSAGVLSVCFGKLQENVTEYSSKFKTSDPLVLKLVKGNTDALLEKNQIKENFTLKELKLHLLDADILPLQHASRDKYENFLQAVQQQSDPVLLANLVRGRSLPVPAPLEKRGVSFNLKDERPNPGFLSGVKESIYQYVLGGKKSSPRVSHISEQNPFNPPDSRKSSYHSAYELEETLEAAKLAASPTSKSAENDYFTAVMKENAALRSQLFRMRSENSTGELSKNVFEQKRQDRKKSSELDSQKHQDLKMWIQHQNMVNSPNSSSRSSSNGLQADIVDKKIAHATVMAASIAAGVTAQLQRKSRKSSRRDSGLTALENLGLESKLGRDDSGVKVTDPSSSARFKKGETFTKPDMFRMKQENDRLAKALGLV